MLEIKVEIGADSLTPNRRIRLHISTGTYYSRTSPSRLLPLLTHGHLGPYFVCSTALGFVWLPLTSSVTHSSISSRVHGYFHSMPRSRIRNGGGVRETMSMNLRLEMQVVSLCKVLAGGSLSLFSNSVVLSCSNPRYQIPGFASTVANLHDSTSASPTRDPGSVVFR